MGRFSPYSTNGCSLGLYTSGLSRVLAKVHQTAFKSGCIDTYRVIEKDGRDLKPL